MKIIFIADYFLEDGLLGGGELNNHEFIKVAIDLGNDVVKMNSANVTPDFIKENINERFIVSNFVLLSKECKDLLTEEAKYLICANPGFTLQWFEPIYILKISVVWAAIFGLNRVWTNLKKCQT